MRQTSMHTYDSMGMSSLSTASDLIRIGSILLVMKSDPYLARRGKSTQKSDTFSMMKPGFVPIGNENTL